MESIISLVVFGIIYSAVYMIKAAMSGNEGVETKPITAEPFPEIEEPESEYGEAPVQTVCVEPVVQPVKKKSVKPVASSNGPVRTTVGGPVLHESVKEPAKKERITIKGSSEAKRAFIYSEVFNRKYQ